MPGPAGTCSILFLSKAQHYAELTLKPKISPFAQVGMGSWDQLERLLRSTCFLQAWSQKQAEAMALQSGNSLTSGAAKQVPRLFAKVRLPTASLNAFIRQRCNRSDPFSLPNHISGADENGKTHLAAEEEKQTAAKRERESDQAR